MMLLTLLMTCCLNAPAEVTLDADVIAVGSILPLPAADPRSAVALGRAPAPGLARRIPSYEILSKIKAGGFGVDDLQVPESILVRRRALTLGAQQARQAVLEAFTRKFPGARVELLQMELPELSLPTGPVSITATLPERFDPLLPVFVRLDLRAAGFLRNAHTRVTARVHLVQPVLRVPVSANSEIRRDDVEWVTAPLEGSSEAPGRTETFDGMLAKRNLSPGQILKPELLYMPLYVRKGDTVTVRATSGGVTVAATMRARASGGLGDMVAVEHLAGPGTVTARIVGPRTLEVIKR
jgi:flagella basal body P-ring formation protein FlgA